MNPPVNCDPPDCVIESCYLETRDGLFFAVKGIEHPPDRWIGVLRYAPDPDHGERVKDGVTFRRLYHFDEQEELIRTAYPHYLAFDPVFNATVQSVPRSMVQRIYDPRRRLLELSSLPVLSPIEKDAHDLMFLLQGEAQVPLSALGITGSLLTGLYTEHSDLDVVAFGADPCRKVHGALRRLLDEGSHPELHVLDSQDMDDLFAQRVADTRMEFDTFSRLERRKVNQGRFRGRTYFIRFIQDPDESGLIYGRSRYTPLGRAAITAAIASDTDSIFTPCRYPVSDVRIAEGMPVADLKEIVSFRGRFCEQAFKGESIYASGILERIEDDQGAIRHRLLLGNHREDTLEPTRY